MAHAFLNLYKLRFDKRESARLHQGLISTGGPKKTLKPILLATEPRSERKFELMVERS